MNTLTPTQRFEYRVKMGQAVKAKVRKLGTGGMDRVAKMLFCDVHSVRRWVAGSHIPAFTMAQRIADVLGEEALS